MYPSICIHEKNALLLIHVWWYSMVHIIEHPIIGMRYVETSSLKDITFELRINW